MSICEVDPSTVLTKLQHALVSSLFAGLNRHWVFQVSAIYNVV